jgi:RNA polymerase sigma-70 factor (ECF subfamily)
MAFQDDRRLVAGLLAGDAGAVELFISEYRQFIYTIFVRYLNLRPEDADELFQRFLFHIWQDDFRRLREWRRNTSLAAYIARIARNLAHDYRREARFDTPDYLDVPLDDPGLANIENRQMMELALSRLSQRDRELIRRHFYLEQSHAEIGQALGITANNVGVALSRAKLRLKKILEDL